MDQNGTLKADAVFEGGGVKGIGLVGAVAIAEGLGYRWMNLAGTSAGAIVASLLAANYTAAELKQVLDELDYRRFKDGSFMDNIPAVGPAASVIFDKGIYDGRFFQGWLRRLLLRKNVRTFRDLIVEEFKDDPRYRYRLMVIASDISRGRMLVLPQDIADYGIAPDDLEVAAAVRMSMSIPFFYVPVRLRNKKTRQYSYFVDGGVLSNFPVWLFDSQGIPEWPTLGFKLVEPEEAAQTPNQVNGPISLLAALFSTMMQAHDARYIKDEHFARTIPIPTLNVGTTEFDISPEKSLALYESGRQAAEKFFATWNFNDYVARYRIKNAPASRGARLRSTVCAPE